MKYSENINEDDNDIENLIEDLFDITDDDIDSIIEESITEESGDEIIVENAIVDNLEDVLREALYEQVKSEVVNSKTLNEDQKVKALVRLENVDFTDDDVSIFMESLLKPAMQLCGYFNESITADPIITSIPVFEVCSILNDAKVGILPIRNENNELIEDNYKMVIDMINDSLTEHNIVDEDVRNSIVNESVNLLALFEFEEIKPDIIDAMKYIYIGAKPLIETIEDETEYAPLTEDTINRINTYFDNGYEHIQEGEVSEQFKDLARKSTDKMLSTSNIVFSESLSQAAISNMALYNFRTLKSECNESDNKNECINNAINENINILESYKKIANDDIKQVVDIVINEWSDLKKYFI
jgi:hypothetical protein